MKLAPLVVAALFPSETLTFAPPRQLLSSKQQEQHVRHHSSIYAQYNLETAFDSRGKVDAARRKLQQEIADAETSRQEVLLQIEQAEARRVQLEQEAATRLQQANDGRKQLQSQLESLGPEAARAAGAGIGVGAAPIAVGALGSLAVGRQVLQSRREIIEEKKRIDEEIRRLEAAKKNKAISPFSPLIVGAPIAIGLALGALNGAINILPTFNSVSETSIVEEAPSLSSLRALNEPEVSIPYLEKEIKNAEAAASSAKQEVKKLDSQIVANKRQEVKLAKKLMAKESQYRSTMEAVANEVEFSAAAAEAEQLAAQHAVAEARATEEKSTAEAEASRQALEETERKAAYAAEAERLAAAQAVVDARIAEEKAAADAAAARQTELEMKQALEEAEQKAQLERALAEQAAKEAEAIQKASEEAAAAERALQEQRVTEEERRVAEEAAVITELTRQRELAIAEKTALAEAEAAAAEQIAAAAPIVNQIISGKFTLGDETAAVVAIGLSVAGVGVLVALAATATAIGTLDDDNTGSSSNVDVSRSTFTVKRNEESIKRTVPISQQSSRSRTTSGPMESEPIVLTTGTYLKNKGDPTRVEGRSTSNPGGSNPSSTSTQQKSYSPFGKSKPMSAAKDVLYSPPSPSAGSDQISKSDWMQQPLSENKKVLDPPVQEPDAYFTVNPTKKTPKSTGNGGQSSRKSFSPFGSKPAGTTSATGGSYLDAL